MENLIIQKVSNTINLRLSFAREVQALKDDGYYVLFNSRTVTSNVVKMKHLSNGRTLTLILTQLYWVIREKGKEIKRVEPIRLVS